MSGSPLKTTNKLPYRGHLCWRLPPYRDHRETVTSVKVVEILVYPAESIGQAACVVMLRSRSLSAASICANASTCM